MRYTPEEKINSLIAKIESNLNEIKGILEKLMNKAEVKPKVKAKAKTKNSKK